MVAIHTERAFEEAVADHLVASGHLHGDPADFEPEIALDTAQLFAWIEASQPKQWAVLTKRHGAAQVRQRFLQRLCRQLDELGALEILRKGVTDYGVKIDLCAFRPAHRLAPEVQRRYELNRLSVTRQVRYNPKTEETIDLVLFVNGLPVATAELKNQLTGQTVEHAIRQYRHDRDPRQPLLAFKRRAIVHFAVDTDLVFMATHLQGKSTEFLPFNRGRGHGKRTGAGNPDNPHGYKTAYLWEDVWLPDSWLDILGRFVHLQRIEKTDRNGKEARVEEKIIFPRFHQLDATRKVEADARARGADRRAGARRRASRFPARLRLADARARHRGAAGGARGGVAAAVAVVGVAREPLGRPGELDVGRPGPRPRPGEAAGVEVRGRGRRAGGSGAPDRRQTSRACRCGWVLRVAGATHRRRRPRAFRSV